MVLMTSSTPRRPGRRWTVAVVSVLGGLVALGVIGEFVLRGIIDDRIRTTASDLPPGVSVTRDDTPALWQVATGRATLHVEATPDALTDTARAATGLPELAVTSESGSLVAQVPLALGGSTQTVDVLLSVEAEDGQAVLRADTVRFGGLALPAATLAEQFGNTELDALTEGVAFPEGESDVAISSAQVTDDGLELGAEVAMW